MSKIKGFQFFLDRLLRGFRSVEKREPDNLEMILIKQEAGQKAKDANKVINVDFDQGRWKNTKLDEDLPPPGSRGGEDDIAAPFASADESAAGIMTDIENRMGTINKANDKLKKLLEEREIIYGKAPKTPPYQKSQADIDFEIIERIKANNKKAVEAFEKRNPKKPEKFFYGGFVEQPELGPTAHGSEALASRTRLAAPGSTSTTSTGLNYLLAEDNDNQRVPFGAGGFNAARRAFLKMMGIGAAGTAAAKSGLFGLLKGGAKKTVAKELTQVPIKNIDGMPAWFKPLVNKVIKEGTDVTKKNAYKERMVVHKTKLPESKTDVYVHQDLDSGDIWVDIGIDKHGFSAGKYGQPVRLNYNASQWIEPDFTKTGQPINKAGKTKAEFNIEEAEFTGGHPENVKFEESVTEKFGEHASDFSEVEEFATGLKKGQGGSGHMASGGLAKMLGE